MSDVPESAEQTPETHEHREAKLHHLSTRVRIIRDTFEILAFTAAGIWGISTFWYQNSFAPAHEAPALEWKVSIEARGERADGLLAVRAQIHGKNSGKAAEQVAAIAVNLFGYRVRQVDAGSDPLRTFAAVAPDAASWERQVGVAQDDGTLIASSAERYGDDLGSFMVRPDEDVTVDIDMVVPRGDFDLLKGRLAVYSIRTKAPIQSKWFTVKTTPDGVLPIATDACRASDDCTVAQNTDSTTLALWPAASPAPSGERASDAGRD